MTRTPRPRRTPSLRVAALEARDVPSLTVPLDPALDQVGREVLTVQAYRGADGSAPLTAFYATFDTGSSVIAWDYLDQFFFEWNGDPGIPIKVPNGATLDAIGGQIVGHVTEPGRVVSDGFHAFRLAEVEDGVFDLAPAYTSAATVTGVQALVGDEFGSPYMPSLTGTPILAPSARHPNGAAALIDSRGASFDLGEVLGDPNLAGEFVVRFPDLHYVSPDRELADVDGSTAPVYVPVSLFGTDNLADPGDGLSQAPVPVVTGAATAEGAATAGGLKLLFDTGAQVSLISSATALALGLDLSQPDQLGEIWGAGYDLFEVPGYNLDRLELPLSDGGTLTFTDVPVFVFDADGATGAVPTALDGILGMNLFNTADQILYDPYRTGGPVVGLTFLEAPDREEFPQYGDGFFDDIYAGYSAPVFSFAGSPDADFGPGSVSGLAYTDADRDGRRDAGETGRAGATVYLDRNRNKRLDPADVQTVTAADGSYHFADLAAGKYQVRVAPAAGTVRTSKPAVFTVTVTDGTDVVARNFGIRDVPARVTRVVVNGGARQRDAVTQLTVVFNEPVSIDPAAFQVLRRDGTAAAFTVSVAEVNGHTEATLTFTEPLANGRYTLSVRSALVTDSAGQALDGNRDGKPGGRFAFRFHRLAGDWNGDARVDYFDRQVGGP